MAEGFMHVVKRDGRKEDVKFDKILNRIASLCTDSQKKLIDIGKITKCVINEMCSGITTMELDNLAAEVCAGLAFEHIEYLNLAGRIMVSNLHKQTQEKFSEVMSFLYHEMNQATKKKSNLISDYTYEMVIKHADLLNEAIDFDRDFSISYFGFKTLEKSYLLKSEGRVVERPQHMYMRVAIGIHGDDIKSVIETYNLMSDKWFTHASPTMFNAGLAKPQMSSCFLLTMEDDSINGIYNTLKNCALISKYAGGIGLNVHCIRATGSYIEGTNGVSNGLIPMLKVFNYTARYVDQGGNKRPGAFAVYLEPWHPDIRDFIQLRKNHGDENKRTRDLFLALWIPDLFMKRVQNNEHWTLMDPHKCPGLHENWGEKFEELYEQYEREGRGKETFKARALWKEILDAQIETGTPYMLYKDSCNRKSNQQNLGTIKCSNLCTEIVEYSSPEEIAVCNLASISLPRFVNRSTRTFDFDKLIEVTGVVTKNLNKIIDLNYYPLKEAELSNKRHRPIGIGVQGLADVFAMMRYPFDSVEAQKLNKKIFEAIYYGALKMSCQLAREEGPYETYPGSPISKGLIQPDMWDVKCGDWLKWDELRTYVKKYGVRNSLLVAPMPTASTAQILGNTECFEPMTSNIYIRRVNSGEFLVINKFMMEDFLALGVWSNDLKNAIIANRGSIQDIKGIPDEMKQLYKTVWEIPQTTIIQMAADRAPFIDQSQSMNLFVGQPTYQQLTTLHIKSWKLGLKTGMYYLRTRPAADPIQFTVDTEKAANFVLNVNKLSKDIEDKLVCSIANGDACEMCQG